MIFNTILTTVRNTQIKAHYFKKFCSYSVQKYTTLHCFQEVLIFSKSLSVPRSEFKAHILYSSTLWGHGGKRRKNICLKVKFQI